MAQKTPLTLSDIYRFGGEVPLQKRLVLRSDYFFKAGRYALCERLVARVLEINPKHYWMLLRLGKLLEKLQRPDDALDAFQRALEAAGPPAEKVFALCSRAGVLTQLGKFAEAESLYLRAIEIKPDYPYAYTGLASILEGLMPAPLDRIASLYRQAIEIDPDIGLWVQSRLDEIAQIGAPGAVELAEKAKPAKASRTQLLNLFNQHRLADLLETLLRDQGQALPYDAVLQRVLDELQALPQDRFTALEEVLLHVADRLAGASADAGGVGTSQETALLASGFYELAAAGPRPLPAGGHFRFLQHLVRHGQVSRAHEAVVQAVSTAGGDPAVLAMAAEAMQALDRPGVARLLLGRAMEIAPDAVAQALAAPGQAPDVDAAWLHLAAVLERANQVQAKKFVSIEKWLALECADAPAAARRAVPDPSGRDDSGASLDDGDAWLAELFSLLGEQPFEALFDLRHYAAQSGQHFDDADAALIHYFEGGWREKFGVHAAFDDDHVRRQLQRQGLDTSAAPLLLLFLRHEKALSLSPNTLFDAALYREGSGLDLEASPWLHYLQGGWRDNGRISPYFDTAYFSRRIRRHSAEASVPPLLLYFCKDPLGDANPLFHAGYYAERYKDFLRGKAPLAHYLGEGAHLGFAPNPFFQPAGRSAQERLDYLKLSAAKV